MENTQVMTQAIMQASIEAMKAGVQAMSEAEHPAKRANGAANIGIISTRVSGPLLKQPKFNRKAKDRYNGLFKL